MLSLLLNWRTWAVLAYVALAGAVSVQTMRLDWQKSDTKAAQAELAALKSEVKAAGEAMQARAIEQAKSDKLKKEKVDAANKRKRTDDAAAIERLRRERDSARGGSVPAGASAADSPNRACFDRAELESALRGFLGEIRGLADEGSAAIVDLDAAKAWAQAP